MQQRRNSSPRHDHQEPKVDQAHRFFVIKPSALHAKSVTMINGPYRELDKAQKARASGLDNRGRKVTGLTAIWKFTFGLKPEYVEGDRW